MNRKTNWEVFIEDQLKEVYQKLFDRIFFLQNKNGYRNESEAEEIVHDTCVRCIEKMNQFAFIVMKNLQHESMSTKEIY